MFVVARVLLIASLLLQSLMGISAVTCEPAFRGEFVCQPGRISEPTSGPKSTQVACPCCADKPMTACCCGDSKPEHPQTPPAEPSSNRAQQFLAIVPTLVGLLPSLSQPAERAWPRAYSQRCCPTNSVQSLLCVWVI